MTEPIAVMSESLFASLQQEAFVFLHTMNDAVAAGISATTVCGSAVLESEHFREVPCKKTESNYAAEHWDGRVFAAMKKA